VFRRVARRSSLKSVAKTTKRKSDGPRDEWYFGARGIERVDSVWWLKRLTNFTEKSHVSRRTSTTTEKASALTNCEVMRTTTHNNSNRNYYSYSTAFDPKSRLTVLFEFIQQTNKQTNNYPPLSRWWSHRQKKKWTQKSEEKIRIVLTNSLDWTPGYMNWEKNERLSRSVCLYIMMYVCMYVCICVANVSVCNVCVCACVHVYPIVCFRFHLLKFYKSFHVLSGGAEC
jgi:hypothetical protein